MRGIQVKPVRYAVIWKSDDEPLDEARVYFASVHPGVSSDEIKDALIKKIDGLTLQDIRAGDVLFIEMPDLATKEDWINIHP